MSDAQSYHLKRTVVLVGMMGSGKTAIGRALSLLLDVPFVDSDAAIEEAAASSIAEIFAGYGEEFFRKREAEVLQRLVSGPPRIVSTGGGAFLAEANRDAIAQHGIAVWLDAEIETLWERVRQKDTRPLLRTPDPLATLSEIFAVRSPIYALAGLQASVDGAASIPETTQTVIDVLLTRPDILEIS